MRPRFGHGPGLQRQAGAMPRGDDFRIDIELDHAEREAARIRALLSALRVRHDLARFEFTRHVRIVPAGPRTVTRS